ncbi:kinesin-like protein KIF24 [Aulostomus maculatus]
MHQSSLDRIQCRVVQAHQEQLEEMNALYHEENALLCQQPGMTFADYVLELEEIMERKARCVHSMRTQLQPYLQTRPAPEHQGEDDHSSVT